MTRLNLTLLGLVLVLILLPLILPVTGGLAEPFAGADGQAQDAITQTHPDYQPWFEPFWEPPSGEIESLLFALQAALGAGLLGYYLGLRRGQSLSGSPAGRGTRRREGVDHPQAAATDAPD
jgi:cobalt/nickel transport protein